MSRRALAAGQASRLFDDGDGLFELNPSRLQCYLDCPRQYRFRYLDRRPERRSFPQATLGSSVHRALRDFYAQQPGDRTLESLLRALRHTWDPGGFRSAAEGEAQMVRAEEMLRRYFDLEDHAAVRAIALESKFSVTRLASRLLVWGRIDRLDAAGDDYVIVDYKTGAFRQDPKSVDESLPLSMYAMAVSEQFRRKVSRIVLYHLADGKRVETRRDPDRLDSDWTRIEQIVDVMRADRSYPARPGTLCRWCDFLDICPEGRAQAGPFLPQPLRRRRRS
ncbi:MAG TPA: PD-(D/E)XK nuclease family protein [Actinomycetota bacterium]|nr:PD-(D/E)XK nuclease family protein [Actinomycetota bacterium]